MSVHMAWLFCAKFDVIYVYNIIYDVHMKHTAAASREKFGALSWDLRTPWPRKTSVSDNIVSLPQYSVKIWTTWYMLPNVLGPQSYTTYKPCYNRWTGICHVKFFLGERQFEDMQCSSTTFACDHHCVGNSTNKSKERGGEEKREDSLLFCYCGAYYLDLKRQNVIFLTYNTFKNSHNCCLLTMQTTTH